MHCRSEGLLLLYWSERLLLLLHWRKLLLHFWNEIPFWRVMRLQSRSEGSLHFWTRNLLLLHHSLHWRCLHRTVHSAGKNALKLDTRARLLQALRQHQLVHICCVKQSQNLCVDDERDHASIEIARCDRLLWTVRSFNSTTKESKRVPPQRGQIEQLN